MSLAEGEVRESVNKLIEATLSLVKQLEDPGTTPLAQSVVLDRFAAVEHQHSRVKAACSKLRSERGPHVLTPAELREDVEKKEELIKEFSSKISQWRSEVDQLRREISSAL